MLDAMRAQVRLLQAQMATFQEQASDESHSQLSRGARGKEPLSDTEDAPESAAPPPSQPPRREDDLDEPDTHVRRRRLQHFS